MALNLNASPYYDDFNDSNKFHRVLFKPGVAVQARELTQLQTLLQDQLGKGFGFVLQEGAVVTGCAETVKTREWVKIFDTDNSSVAIDNNTLANYVGDTITGGTTGLTAEITNVATGTQGAAPATKMLYFQYTNGSATHTEFQTSEVLTVTSTDSGRNGDTFVAYTSTSSTDQREHYRGTTNEYILDPGIIYAMGSFIKTDKISSLADRYMKTSSVDIGFVVTEATVGSATESSLLDPAQGSFNYNAPGADRLKYTVELKSFTASDTKPENFFTYVKIQHGGPVRAKIKDNPLGGLGDILAKRTRDESGDYTVSGMTVNLREHLKDSVQTNGLYTAAGGGKKLALSLGISPGVSYVSGYKRTLATTKRINLQKPNEFKNREGVPVSTSFGNYLPITYVSGIWDIDGGASVDLYDTLQNGASSAAGTKVGTAKARHVVYSSGTAGSTGAVYSLYLYDVKMTSGNFQAVKGVRYENAVVDGIANVSLTGSIAEIKETQQNKMLFAIPNKNIKTLASDTGNTYDYSFQYTKEFDATLHTSDGDLDISLSGTETFPYDTSNTALTDTIKKANIIVLSKDGYTQNSGAIAAGQYIDLTAGTSVVKCSGSQNMNIDLGGAVTIPGAGESRDVKVYVNVQVSDTAPVTKALATGRIVKIDTQTNPGGSTGPWNLGLSDGFKLTSVTAGTNSDYSTGQLDYTDQFRFINGQADNFKGHAKIGKASEASLDVSTNRYLVVTVQHFTETNNGVSFSCVDSYPVDDTSSPSANTIRTEEIPVFRSQIHGDFDLRDSVDFRPRLEDTAVSTATLGSASVNPVESFVTTRPSGGLTNPVPASTFTTDYNYYRGKSLRVVLDSDGIFRVLEGAYGDNPIIPSPPEGTMSLATINLPPYPCLSPHRAKQVGRPDYGATVKQISNKRFTMRDIGTLETRIKNLEYYASLNLLENFAKDQTIVNSGGTDRFKNGILVDGFTGHNVGAVLDPDYKISIDPKLKHARPFFNTEAVPLTNFTDILTPSTVTNLVRTGNVITLPYRSQVFRQQPLASQTENLAKELTFHYNGEIDITPEVDNWVATDVQPTVTTNFDGNYDAWENMASAWGTQWGSWEDVGAAQVTSTTQTLNTQGTNNSGTGTSNSSLFTTTTTQQNQTRQGVSIDISASTESQSLGEKVIDVAFAPFMRSRAIDFTAWRMKPNTRVYAFFDGEDVNEHCGPVTTTTGAVTYNTAMTTDADGRLVGRFLIPEGTFNTGARLLKLTDSATNNQNNARTSAVATYESTGLRQKVQEDIISLRTANVNANVFAEDRTTTDISTDISIGAGTPLPPPPAPVIIDNTVTITEVVEVPVVETQIVTEIVTVTETVPGPTVIVETIVEVPVVITETIIVEVDPPVIDPPVFVTEPEIFDFEFDLWETIGADFWSGGFSIDPLAQTFKVEQVPGGIFLTDIELFFKTKPASGNNGVTLEIREVINGVPGPKVIPGGRVYHTRGNINTSTESGGVTTYNGTTFRFPDMLYLKNNTEYCFVPKPENDDTGYELWIAQLGENQFGTTNRVDKQPAAGMMFSSANDRTWSAHQDKDIMFTIRRAQFLKNTEFTGHLVNRKQDWMNLTWGTGKPTTESFVSGENINGFSFTITGGGSGYTSAPTVGVTRGSGDTSGTGLAITATVSAGAITGLTVTNPGYDYTAVPTLTFTGGGGGSGENITVTLNRGRIDKWNSLDKQATVDVTAGKFTTGMLVGSSLGYGTIESFTDKVVNDIALNFGILEPATGVSTTTHVALTDTGAGSANTGTYEGVDLNATNTLTKEKTIYSNSNEQTSYSDTRTGRVRIKMSSNSDSYSPYIDLAQSDLLCIKNHVNNSTTNETGRTGGNASSKYITRRVILEEGMDAEDLQVYIDSAIPASGSLKVYGKFLNAADPGDFQEDLNWVELESNTSPKENTEDFAEYSFKIPAKSGGIGVNGTGILEYDLSVVPSISVTAGGSSYGSVPAVEISGGGGFGATAVATINGSNQVSGITVTNPGRGYTSTPTVTISGGGGSGATATAATPTTVTYTGYKTFAVKIVPLTTDTCKVPKFKDLRAIALQV